MLICQTLREREPFRKSRRYILKIDKINYLKFHKIYIKNEICLKSQNTARNLICLCNCIR